MSPISLYITLLPETPRMSLRPGMTRLELSHRASPQISLAWPFGREHKPVFPCLVWGRVSQSQRARQLCILHSVFLLIQCVHLNIWPPISHSRRRRKFSELQSRGPMKRPCSEAGAALGSCLESLLPCFGWARDFLDSGFTHTQPMPGCVATPSFSLDKLPSLFNWWRVF